MEAELDRATALHHIMSSSAADAAAGAKMLS